MKLTSRQRRLIAEKEAGERPERRPEEEPPQEDELGLDLDIPDESPGREELGAVNPDGVDRQSDLEVMQNGLKTIALLKKAISMTTAAKFIVSAPKKSGGLGRTDLAPQDGQFAQPMGGGPQQWAPTLPSIESQIQMVISQVSDDLNTIKNKTEETEAVDLFNKFFDLSDVDVSLDSPDVSPQMEDFERVVDDIGLTESERYVLYGALNSLIIEMTSGGGVGMGSGGSFFGNAATDEKPEKTTLFRKSDKKPYTSNSSRWYLPPTAGKKREKRETKRTV